MCAFYLTFFKILFSLKSVTPGTIHADFLKPKALLLTEILYIRCGRMGFLSFTPVTVLFLVNFNFGGEA